MRCAPLPSLPSRSPAHQAGLQSLAAAILALVGRVHHHGAGLAGGGAGAVRAHHATQGLVSHGWEAVGMGGDGCAGVATGGHSAGSLASSLAGLRVVQAADQRVEGPREGCVCSIPEGAAAWSGGLLLVSRRATCPDSRAFYYPTAAGGGRGGRQPGAIWRRRARRPPAAICLCSRRPSCSCTVLHVQSGALAPLYSVTQASTQRQVWEQAGKPGSGPAVQRQQVPPALLCRLRCAVTAPSCPGPASTPQCWPARVPAVAEARRRGG